MQSVYANIIVDISHEKVDRPFQYRIPPSLQELIEPGMCVTIPFGKGNTERTGYVLEVTNRSEYPPEKVKEILSIGKGKVSIEEKQMLLAAWMKKQYGSTMIQSLKTVLPSKKSVKQLEHKTILLNISRDEAYEVLRECKRKNQTARCRLLTELLEGEDALAYELVTGKLNVSAQIIKSMAEKKIITIESSSYFRRPIKDSKERDEKKELSAKQKDIVTSVLADYDREERKTYLIHGITGSGKTEVYIQIIEGIVARGKQAIVLIPEIALTYQTVLRFHKRFGERVSVLNSTLSPGEKYDQCERAKNGEIDVIIGPRSALFTPFPEIGVIIIDEEHETSYKSEQNPKYHARETAERIAKIHDASVVLGSATPSLEAYFRAEKGEYTRFTLDERMAGGELPTVYTVDLREELKRGNRSIFSEKLQVLMEERFRKGEQVMLFLNRRGYAGFVSCRACGYVVKCPHCDVSLSEHYGNKMICHYCGYGTEKVTSCPECGSKFISGFRAGTQQIEERLKALYPQVRVLRMDADTTKQKESYEEILSSFANNEADVLIGTQMIVKGHDFPNVTLVGVLAADLSLCVSDYRAGERTFQLLTQAAGRAGRGEKAGEVVIQTYQPEHYSVVHAANQNYRAFYEEEILYRELLRYPPACHMLAVFVTAKEEEKGLKLAERLAEYVRPYSREEESIQKRLLMIGPAPANVSKVNDVYRYVFYIKYENYETLIEIKDLLEEKIEAMELKSEGVQFDFDPMNSY